MKSLIVEVKKAIEYREKWSEAYLIDFMINFSILRRNTHPVDYNCYYFSYDYSAGKETVGIMKGDNLIGILHAKFPIGFIHETAFEDFKNLNFYHLIKVDNFEKQEWYVDLHELKKLAPEIHWRDIYEKSVNSQKFSVSDFDFVTI